jgi:acetyl-CoA acetyltransferase
MLRPIDYGQGIDSSQGSDALGRSVGSGLGVADESVVQVKSGLSGKYAIVGVGDVPSKRYTPETLPSKLQLATTAIEAAVADAGLALSEVDCLLSYGADATDSVHVATALGLSLSNYVDIVGGGSSSEALITMAAGMIVAGSCTTVVIYRALHGYSGERVGLGPAWTPTISSGLAQAYGVFSAAQQFAPVYASYMARHGITSEQVANVKATQSLHASANPRALYPKPVTVTDVLESRMIVRPVLHLLDCCVESDGAAAIVVTDLQRARSLRQHPIQILASLGRVSRQNPEYYYWGDLTELGAKRARRLIFDIAGVTPDDVDLTAAYDCFTVSSTMLLERFGFCDPGGGGDYVASDAIRLGGRRPNNTSGGQLCEGYTHGLSLVIENVRQLRWQADDYCPGAAEGIHTFDYRPGGCRQVRSPSVAMNMGWRTPPTQSAMILARD